MMNLVQISNLFNTLAAVHSGLGSYHFGWPSDRVRSVQNNYDDPQSVGTTFPRVMFIPPEDASLDVLRLDDRIPVTLIFDDLFGYNAEGEVDTDTMAEKWTNLRLIALQYVRLIRQAGRELMPLVIAIEGDTVRWSADMTAGNQRLITVILRFTVFTKASCSDLVVDFSTDVPAGHEWPPSDTVDLEKTVP